MKGYRRDYFGQDKSVRLGLGLWLPGNGAGGAK